MRQKKKINNNNKSHPEVTGHTWISSANSGNHHGISHGATNEMSTKRRVLPSIFTLRPYQYSHYDNFQVERNFYPWSHPKDKGVCMGKIFTYFHVI